VSVPSRDRLLELLASTTTSFIARPALGLTDAIEDTLRAIGELFDVDRAYLFQTFDDGVTIDNTVEWCAPGIAPQRDELQSIPTDMFPWWIDELMADRPIRLRTLDDLPADAHVVRAILEPQGIISLLVLPVTWRGRFAGFVGFDHVRSERVWTDEEISVLRFIGSALAHALERQRLDAHLERAAAVLSSAREGVVVEDAEGQVLEVNPAFTRMTGRTLSDLTDRRLPRLLAGPSSDEQTVASMLAAEELGEPYDVEILAYSPQGSPTWMQVRRDPVRDDEGRLQGFMNLLTDIDERKRVDRLKEEFVSTVSHELRTPLTAITGALSLLAADGTSAGAGSPQTRRLIDMAQRNAERLARLIDDLLAFESLEAEVPEERVRVALMPVVDEAVQSNAAYADQFGVHLRVIARDDEAVVEVAPLRLQQVLANLLSNAAKHSPAGSAVDIAVCRDGEQVQITVTDRGPGVPEHFRDRIFERFAQADASDARSRGGTGLGLAISRAFVEAMDGTIGYESTPGEGAAFTVRLPVAG
jgi:PAS domain S-box-containing protein